MRRPMIDMDMFRIRQNKLMGLIDNGVLILPASFEKKRNHDVNFSFRQASNFWYLTGFEEPDAIFVLRPGEDVERIMYVRKKDPSAETWDGFRYGPEGVCQHFGMQVAHNLDEFDDTIVDYIRHADRLFYQHNVNPEIDNKINSILVQVARSHGRKGLGLMPVFDICPVVGELRLFKSEYELKKMKIAAEISGEAHINMMKYAKPGINERQIEAVFNMTYMMAGAPRAAYPPIIAGGNNATTLHYGFNDEILNDGDLLLIDAGCEVEYYAADITRTFPINGKFSTAQKRVYQAVLDVQKELIELVKPGVEYSHLREYCTERLVDALLDLGLLKGRREDIISSGEYKKYYPHGFGHWLGVDVHDAGLYEKNNEPRYLEPGMAFTVEPGLYIPKTDIDVAEEYRGIGVRIEDNVVVTALGCDNLTQDVPKEVDELEEIVGTGLSVPLIRASAY